MALGVARVVVVVVLLMARVDEIDGIAGGATSWLPLLKIGPFQQLCHLKIHTNINNNPNARSTHAHPFQNRPPVPK